MAAGNKPRPARLLALPGPVRLILGPPFYRFAGLKAARACRGCAAESFRNVGEMAPIGLRHITAWVGTLCLGVILALGQSLVAPEAAWAQQACDASSSTDEVWSVAEAVLMSANDEDPPISPVPDADLSRPCEFSDYDSPSYNICYAANPRPLSTMPHWLAELQAEEAVSTVFEQVNDFHSGRDDSSRPLRMALSASMIHELITVLSGANGPGQGLICTAGVDVDDCESTPPASATVAHSTLAVGLRPADPQIDPPTRHNTQRLAPPLVDLRVGPAAEHRSPPDRPPPA